MTKETATTPDTYVEVDLSNTGHYEAKIVIDDINDGTSRVVLLHKRTGLEISLTPAEAADLGNATRFADSRSETLLDESRRLYAHPKNLSCADLLTGDPTIRQMHRVEDTPSKEGDPIIVWEGLHGTRRGNRNANPPERYGWRLTFAGSDEVTVAFAAWNSPEGIVNLVNQMGDKEALMIMAGMINPEQTSVLSARMVARRLMEDKTVKRSALTPIRKMLTENGLTTPDSRDRYNRGRLRVMSMEFGHDAGKLPVACAIQAPKTGHANNEMIAALENRLQGKPYQEQRVGREEQYKLWRAEWFSKAAANVHGIRGGWRVVDLPKPGGGWQNRENPVLWVTRIPEDIWSEISRAVEREASQVNMNRGSTF